MTLEDSLTAKKACERSAFNIGFAVIRQPQTQYDSFFSNTWLKPVASETPDKF
jgi:hypothetical protein